MLTKVLSAVLVVTVAGVASAGAPPAPVSAKLVAHKDGPNQIAVVNLGKKAVAQICYEAVYLEDSERRQYSSCEPFTLPAKGKTTFDVCSGCSNELPVLSELILTNVDFADGTRWAHLGTAAAPKNGAPLALIATNMTYRLRGTDCKKCRTEVVVKLQNTSTKKVGGYSLRYHDPNGKEQVVSVTPNNPIDPGEVVSMNVDGKDAQLDSAWYVDKSEWKAAGN